LSVGWKNYFSNLKKGEIKKKQAAYIKQCARRGVEIKKDKLYNLGKPKFKKKGTNESFYLEGKIIIDKNKIKIPKFGWVKMSESYDESFEVKNVVISRKANHWFISFKKDVAILKIKDIDKKPSIGVDLGVKSLAVLSDGLVFDAAKAFGRNKRKLKIAQRKLSKKYVEKNKIQSNNYYKTKQEVAKIHYRISCIRQDAIHKLTTYLAKNHGQIIIEDLNVSGMMKNKRLAGAIQDGGFFEFRRQLEYKTKWYGSKLIVIDRFFPSSKMCSCCGNIKQDLKLKDRVYICEKCGMKKDRDVNAAININNYFAVSSTVNACGELNKPYGENQKELNEARNKQQTNTTV
jgi:putative transposase